jgi:hypothetical protein
MSDLLSAKPVETVLAAIREYLDTIRFGSIALTIHEGRVVQLDVTEKRRLST